jgi:RNA polymerase sigma factor (sigma-70 family)
MTEKELGELFEKYNKDVFFYALSLLKHEQDAEDIVIAVFLKIFKYGLHDVENKKRAIINNTRQCCIDHIRQKIRHKTIEDSIIIDDSTRIEESHESELAWRCIKKMSKARRRVMILLYFHGYDEDQVANELGISINTVYAHNKKGIDEIKKYLKTGTGNGKKSQDYHHPGMSDKLPSILRAIKNGANYKAVVATFGISAPCYYKYKKLALSK